MKPCWIIHFVMRLATNQREGCWNGGSSTIIPHREEQEIRRVILGKLQRRLPVKSSPYRREAELVTPIGD